MTDRTEGPVPGESGPRWVLGFVEPLLSTQARVRLNDDLRAICRRQPDWAIVFLAGIASDMVLTYPDDDAWRHLSARIQVPDGEDLTRGEHPPEETGATHPDGRAFGTYLDGADVLEVVFETNLELDIAFAPLVDPLPSTAAALVAFAADGYVEAQRAARAIHHVAETAGEDAGEALFTAGAEAIRWAVHRRRSYGVTDDDWPIQSGWMWASRADRITSGGQWPAREIDASQAAQHIAEHAIAADIY